MPSKFGGIPVDEQKPSGSKFGGVPVSDEMATPKEPTSAGKAYGKALAEQAGGGAGGLVGAELGAGFGAMTGPLAPVAVPLGAVAGGILGYFGGEKLQEKFFEDVPQSVKEKFGFGQEQRAREKKEHPTSTLLGELSPMALDVGRLGYMGYKGITSMLKTPEELAKYSDYASHGEKISDVLTKNASELHEAISSEAKALYDDAFDAARKAQAKGNPFAVSKQGQGLIADLEKEKTVIAGGKEFEKGAEKIAGIDRLIKAIKGTTTGGYKRVSAEGPRGKIYKYTGTAPKTTEKDIEAVVEELRFLRDIDAKGKPHEAYASLDAKYKRDLIKKLENSLYDWNDNYRVADEAYKAASQKLASFKTQLMSNALKGEKFNPKDLVASPEQFGKKFFSDVNSVQNLKQVVNDDAKVVDLAKEFSAIEMSNKTPEEVRKWAFSPDNTGWLREAGIIDDVQKYANQAVSAEKKQKILSNLGMGAIKSTAGVALGLPVYYGIKRTLGF